ncbi:MAG TPA: hypothetical protein VHX61_04320 [Rhizomicrobium sp.]|jgi:hypothetical protein|nr:hypothetical protein [Rhizomicrobium sp.]
MSSRLPLAAAACAALFLSSAPGWAIETVTLPQNSDGTTNFQDPDAQAQSKFSTDQNGTMNVGGLGKFHFSMSSSPGFSGNPGDPGYYYGPGSSSSAGYGNPNQPGSEFYNSGYPFGH